MTYYLHNNGVIRETSECPGEGSYCQPQLLAVIPVDDREEVYRLIEIEERQVRDLKDLDRVSRIQAALREFADPKPPRPEEPLGLGAVVEDDEGDLWVRRCSNKDDADHLEKPWLCGSINKNWLIVDAVKVLSEGVS